MGETDHQLPAANPGLLSEHERSVLLALMLLRQTVCRCRCAMMPCPTHPAKTSAEFAV